MWPRILSLQAFFRLLYEMALQFYCSYADNVIRSRHRCITTFDLKRLCYIMYLPKSHKCFGIKAVPVSNMSRIVRKPDFCLGENKGADQLRGNREADQRLFFSLHG